MKSIQLSRLLSLLFLITSFSSVAQIQTSFWGVPFDAIDDGRIQNILSGKLSVSRISEGLEARNVDFAGMRWDRVDFLTKKSDPYTSRFYEIDFIGNVVSESTAQTNYNVFRNALMSKYSHYCYQNQKNCVFLRFSITDLTYFTDGRTACCIAYGPSSDGYRVYLVYASLKYLRVDSSVL